MRVRQSMRSSLLEADVTDSILGNGGGGDGDDDNEAGVATPSTARQRRRTKDVKGDTKTRSGSTRRRYVPAAERQVLDEDWYREPPPRAETVIDPEPEKSDAELLRMKILGGYTDIVTHLPIEIYRSTTFIKSLDQSYLTKTRRIDQLCRQLQRSSDLTKTLEYRSEICRLMAESKQDRAEAVAEASKLQQLVQSHITLLSADLDKLENPTSKTPIINNNEEPIPSSKRRSKKTSAAKAEGQGEAAGDDIPIDDDEPLYCTCQRVSFGQMIACESSPCQHGEWFHFECLKFTRPPQGKWWCPGCRQDGLASKRFMEEHLLDDGGGGGKSEGRKNGEGREEKRRRNKIENRRREAERAAKIHRRSKR